MGDGAGDLWCPCGGRSFERVVVYRPPKPPHVTDFMACEACRAVYHSPQVGAPAPPSARPAMPPGPPRGASDEGMLKTYGLKPERHDVPWTPEEQARFDAQVARVNRSKKRR